MGRENILTLNQVEFKILKNNVHSSVFRNIYLNRLNCIVKICFNIEELVDKIFIYYTIIKLQNYPSRFVT